MSLFDQLVTEALKNQPGLVSLRIVVEKELLHHDIFRVLSQNALLTGLTFIGGTCLRACYGGVRLSEDLDFTGGEDFSSERLSTMGTTLLENLQDKYGLRVQVTEPKKESGNVDTWKIKVETRPEQKHFPAQRINIDICRVRSYERQPMLLLNPYGVDMGTAGLVIQAQSREEIYTDKILAFALRPNRIKHRDLWDMAWLHQQGLRPHLNLIPNKLEDRNITQSYFYQKLIERQQLLKTDNNLSVEFFHEMARFLPTKMSQEILAQNQLWDFVTYLMTDFVRQLAFNFGG